MAKDKKQESSNAAAPAAQETAPVEAVAQKPVVAEQSTPNMALAAPANPMLALAERLPARYKDDVVLMVRPSPSALAGIVQKLPATDQERMMELIRKLNPKKQGAHTERTGFAPTIVRLFQGTGDDPLRPADLPPGHFYTSDSRALGKNFVGAVLGFYEGRILWPPQGQKGEGSSKVPLCVSMDRVKGSRYGECGTCPKANMQYNQGGCTRDVCVYLLDKGMTGIYELHFSKTSEGAGNALIKVITKSENIWDRWITFSTEERKEEGRRWFVQKATPVTEGETATNKGLHDLFVGLSKVLDCDVYFPGLANTYDRAKSSTEAGVAEGTPANTADESMLGLGGANPDYSGGSSGNV
jgi:hypothetical protein